MKGQWVRGCPGKAYQQKKQILCNAKPFSLYFPPISMGAQFIFFWKRSSVEKIRTDHFWSFGWPNNEEEADVFLAVFASSPCTSISQGTEWGPWGPRPWPDCATWQSQGHSTDYCFDFSFGTQRNMLLKKFFF